MASTILLLLLTALFAYLGMWQTSRGAEKFELEQQFEHAGVQTLEQALESGNRFSHIELTGHFDQQRHVLLDNQMFRGRAGVHVFTPFTTSNGITILVNRGWLPLAADRSVMPDITTPAHLISISGIFNEPPKPGRMLGPADSLSASQWPQLVTYLNMTDIADALSLEIPTSLIQLSTASEGGFGDREWKAVFLSSDKHKAYAFQWYALATACIFLWVFLGFRKTNRSKTWP